MVLQSVASVLNRGSKLPQTDSGIKKFNCAYVDVLEECQERKLPGDVVLYYSKNNSEEFVRFCKNL